MDKSKRSSISELIIYGIILGCLVGLIGGVSIWGENEPGPVEVINAPVFRRGDTVKIEEITYKGMPCVLAYRDVYEELAITCDWSKYDG